MASSPSRPPALLLSRPAATPVAPASTVGELAHPVPAIGASELSGTVAEMFARHEHLYSIAVVDDHGCPIGLLNRFKFIERLSGDAGARALLVSELMERAPLTLDEATSIETAGDVLVAAGDQYIFDGFIVTRDGRYSAVATCADLMRALTERRHSELWHLAQHDVVTGLPNRHQFRQRLNDLLLAAGHTRARLGLLFIDLDRFKQINDTFGHSAADVVLGAFGERLRRCVRRRDIVARLAGDEFAVVLDDIGNGAAAEGVAATILAACATPIDIGGQDLVVSCSIGIAIFPDDALTGEALLDAADAAAMHAKHVRNTHQRYVEELSFGDPRPDLSPGALRQIVDQGLISVYYQPKIDLQSNRICGVEALVRCESMPGHISTENFVRLAEDYGLIGAVSEQVIRTAVGDLRAWDEDPGARDLRLSVNISSVQLRHAGLAALIARLLDETGFEPQRLELELTESAAMLAGRSAAAALRAVRDIGCRLAIDDFGTGYSSLSQLERMPVDALKIDRSFVAGLGQPDHQGVVVKAIIALGHALGLQVIAEGVETDAQLVFLKDVGCDIAQGYYFGRPMSAGDMRAAIRTGLSGAGGL
jgi:diguanylate cyclase (GGDEF)-like protein